LHHLLIVNICHYLYFSKRIITSFYQNLKLQIKLKLFFANIIFKRSRCSLICKILTINNFLCQLIGSPGKSLMILSSDNWSEPLVMVKDLWYLLHLSRQIIMQSLIKMKRFLSRRKERSKLKNHAIIGKIYVAILLKK